MHAGAVAAAAEAVRERDAAAAEVNTAAQAQATAEQQHATAQAKAKKLQAEADKLRAEATAAGAAKQKLQAQLEGVRQKLADVQRSAEAGRSYRCRAEAAEQQVAESGRAVCTLQQELQTVRSALQVPSHQRFLYI